MDKLAAKIFKDITQDGCRLSIVYNPDGVLRKEYVQQPLSNQCSIIFGCGDQWKLRLFYELQYKTCSNLCVFVLNVNESIPPDIGDEAYVTEFNIEAILPMYDREALKKLNYASLVVLLEHRQQRRVNYIDTMNLVKDVEQSLYESVEYLKKRLEGITPQWQSPTQTMEDVSKVLIDAIKNGNYDGIEPEILKINNSFQEYLDNNYFSNILSSSSVLHPYCVTKIMPYLKAKYQPSDRIALVVVDGMSYWQYMVLGNELKGKGLKTNNSFSFAWIPTITILSRQAIFRGSNPRQDYSQSPIAEQGLWENHWRNEGFSELQVCCMHDVEWDELSPLVTRLAYVTNALDDCMHGAYNIQSLYRNTQDWSKNFAKMLFKLHDAGFRIHITSDHGNVQAAGWRKLTQQESVHLYDRKFSRSKRHLMYKGLGLDDFWNSTPEEHNNMLKHDNWIVWRDNKCFDTNKKMNITHGGAHFLEVLVPFITID